MTADRLTIRLGSLSGPLADYCEKHGISASQLTRKLIAKKIGVEEPDMPPNGFAGMTSEQHAEYAHIRWAKHQSKKGKS